MRDSLERQAPDFLIINKPMTNYQKTANILKIEYHKQAYDGVVAEVLFDEYDDARMAYKDALYKWKEMNNNNRRDIAAEAKDAGDKAFKSLTSLLRELGEIRYGLGCKLDTLGEEIAAIDKEAEEQ